jgi:hypothetical protein
MTRILAAFTDLTKVETLDPGWGVFDAILTSAFVG